MKLFKRLYLGSKLILLRSPVSATDTASHDLSQGISTTNRPLLSFCVNVPNWLHPLVNYSIQ